MSLFSKKTKTSSKIASPSAAPSGNYKSADGMIESQNNALVPKISMTGQNPNAIYIGGNAVASKNPNYKPPVVATTTPKPVVKPKVAIKTPAKTGTSSTSSTSSVYSNPMTIPGATTSTSGEPTIGQGLFKISGEADPYQEQLDYYKSERDRALNPDDIFQEKLRMYQGQMDSIRDIYAAKLAETRQQGIGRFGSARAAQARGGLLGSDFAGAQNDTVQTFNNEAEDLVRAEEASRIAEIMGLARSESSAEISSRREAQRQGAEAYTNWLAKSQERKQTGLSNLAKAIVSSGITDIKKLGDDNIKEIASKYGTSTDAVRAAIAEKIPAVDTKDRYVTLSDGASIYDTKTGKIVAENNKNFAPKSGSGGYSSGASVSDAAMNFAKQIQTGAATLQNVPSAMRAEVATALMQLPSPKLQELDGVITLIDELKSNPKLDNITGPIDQFAGGMFGEAAVAKNLYNQLQGVLSLEGRSKLKGSGSISDFEFKILQQAQSALGRNIPASAMKDELEKVRDILDKRRKTLSSQGFVSDTQQNSPESSGQVAVNAPNGKTYYFNNQTDANVFKAKAGIQ